VTQSDATNFAGVTYSGFVNGETASSALSGTATVTRSNSSTNLAGSYTGVLIPGGQTANNGNYTITTSAGNYTIIPADQLFVQLNSTSTTYGSAPSYSANNPVAKYLTCSIAGCGSGSVNIINTFTPTISGNAFSMSDGVGGSASFTITPLSATVSGSGNTNVGSYQLGYSNATVVSNNFSNTIVLTGSLVVSPLTLTTSQLNMPTISKTYDASTSIASVSTNASTSSGNNVLSGDAVTLTRAGAYTDANAGTNKSVTLALNLTGNDAGNYLLSSEQYSANIGTINKATITITGANTTTTYNGSAQTNTATATVNGSAVTLSGNTLSTGINNQSFALSGSGSGTNASTSAYADSLVLNAASGTSADNYAITYSNGGLTINQLASVTYTGTSGGNWSSSANWAGGATPTLSNVATVVIPTGITVIYDAANLSSLTPTSAITDNGTLSFTGSSPISFANAISGTGSLSLSGTGALTLSGANTFTGGIALGSGSSLIAGSNLAFGTGAITSAGGSLSTASGVTLPYLTVNGPITLTSNIASLGNQTYNGAVAINNAANTTTLSSSAGNIRFEGTLRAGAANQALVLSALAGGVTFNDQVGVATRTYDASTQTYSPISYSSYEAQASNNLTTLTVDANTIHLNADISTLGVQTYTGAMLVGNNGSNGTVRVLLSQDPAITINGTVDDSSSGTHSLDIKAVTVDTQTPSVTLNGAVGSSAPLASIAATTGLQDTSASAAVSAIDTSASNLVGSIVVAQNVTTTSDQTYTANTVTLGGGTNNQTLALSSTQSGDIIFNTGVAANNGGVSQASPSATVAVYVSGGAVTGLSSNINYTTYNSASSNDSSSNLSSYSGYTGNLSGAIQNSLNMAFLKTASESIFDQNLEGVDVGFSGQECGSGTPSSSSTCL
jgi:hypothetical protein